MELTTLQQLIADEDPQRVYSALRSEITSRFNQTDYFNLDPRTHRIMLDRWHRPDRIVDTPIPNDPAGRTERSIVPVSRIAVAFQQEIVDNAVSFSVGGKITLKAETSTPDEEALLKETVSQWNKNKVQYKIADLARRMFSETEAAVLFFSDKDPDGTNGVRMRMRVMSPALGYTLYPVFNADRNMIAFGVDYVGEYDSINFDLYTDDKLYRYQQGKSTLELVNIVKLEYGKIPVVYFNQQLSEWNTVQSAIDRFETALSNLCDTNDYNGSPILFAEGEIQGFAKKGEAGKLITGSAGAKLSYITWESAPESIKLEFDTLKEVIYTKTRTVDLSPMGLKNLGSVPSGVAFDRILISAHMKAADKQAGTLGEGVQRMVNFLQSAVVNFINIQLKSAKGLYIEPQFSIFRIDDTDDRIQSMSAAMPGEVLVSRRTAVAYIGIADDVDKELEDIKADQPQPLDTLFNKPKGA